jgi:hypothetical protein
LLFAVLSSWIDNVSIEHIDSVIVECSVRSNRSNLTSCSKWTRRKPTYCFSSFFDIDDRRWIIFSIDIVVVVILGGVSFVRWWFICCCCFLCTAVSFHSYFIVVARCRCVDVFASMIVVFGQPTGSIPSLLIVAYCCYLHLLCQYCVAVRCCS